MKKFIPVLIATILIAGIGIWATNSNSTTTESANTNTTPVKTVSVGTSFYVLDEFVRQIGGEYIDITVSPPAGIDIHSFEPTAKQIAELQAVDLFLFQGAGVDSWAEEISEDLQSKGVTVLEINEHVTLHSTDEEHADEEHADEEHADEETDEHGHGEFDPHTWLDPVLAQTIVNEITSALTELDPNNADTYARNAAELIDQLEQLDTSYETGLADCELREIIVAHDAFGYLGKRYNIEMHAIAGVSPEEEPSAKKLTELTEIAKEHDIQYIFFEALTSPKTAETIANEVGIQTAVLDPIEGITADETRTYTEIMRDNLTNLRTAMKCAAPIE